MNSPIAPLPLSVLSAVTLELGSKLICVSLLLWADTLAPVAKPMAVFSPISFISLLLKIAFTSYW